MKLIIFAGLLAMAAPAAQADNVSGGDVWHWVRVTPDSAGWSTCKGDAPVTFEHHHFVADLVCSGGAQRPNYQVTVHVEGEVHGNKVTAKMTDLATDASPLILTGTMRSTRYSPINQPKIEAGEDVMTLNGGAAFLGLSRSAWQPKS